MNHIELMSKQVIVPVGTAIDMLSQILLSAHQMNLGDKPGKIRQDKSTYVRRQIISLYKAGKVEGEIKYYDTEDQYSDPSGYYLDGSCEFVERDRPYRMDMKLSKVNIQQLAREIAVQLENTGSVVPTDLMVLMGDASITPVAKAEAVSIPVTEAKNSYDNSVGGPDIKKVDSVMLTEEPTPEAVIIPSVVEKDIQVEPAAKGHQYCFIKRGKTWDIKFGNIALGVKHLTGMDYIKILLQSPYEEMGVLDLQSMMNPDVNKKSSHIRPPSDVIINSDESDEPDFDEMIRNAIKGLSEEYRDQLSMLRKEIETTKSYLEEATEFDNTIEVSRLTSLLSMYQEDFYNICNARSDDPELDANRKKVYKNIEDARKSIQVAEIDDGHTDTPLYNYLKKYIETGYTCKFNPLVDDHIHWIF